MGGKHAKEESTLRTNGPVLESDRPDAFRQGTTLEVLTERQAAHHVEGHLAAVQEVVYLTTKS